LITFILALEFYVAIKFAIVSTKCGWVGLGGSEVGLVLLTLPKSSRKAALSEVNEFAADAVEDTSAFGDLPYRIQRYFYGEKVSFPDSLDLSGATDFHRAVWNATRSIPYGETRTYAWVAQQIRRPQAFRAVGGALARNPFPIIVPCHRVLASNGNLGGFSGGLVLKRRLLKLEAALLDVIS
jgi:methylated-DNA-[protein]-cysteine S-methyltransferase